MAAASEAAQAFSSQPLEETPVSKGGGSKARVAFNELLIAEVFKRRQIWDASSPDYRNSLVRSEHWKAIATVLGSKGSHEIVSELKRLVTNKYMRCDHI
ncbi:hypothetical protein HPB47_025205 [Ixodes persulcatus]|uniref:Uncharacterized protein n=1 Tax=Ixodes persulcatus TaxID=34615 RepID=A0AC60Q3Z8_IXOPE|nr:hypothetical protein HPB47_025205 [Ixodes persulcatus]